MELHKRVKDALHNGAPEALNVGDVVEFGKKLEEAFNAHKKSRIEGAGLPDFDLYKDAFGACVRCAHLPKFPMKGNRKQGASSSSSGSSEQLESGRYNRLLLDLIYKCVEGFETPNGVMWSSVYWRNFTDLFNVKVAQHYLDEPVEFKEEEVVCYGRSLRRKYEHEPEASDVSLIEDFDYYKAAFGKCYYCCFKPTYNAFSCSSFKSFRNKHAPGYTDLAVLMNENAISMDAMNAAADQFRVFLDEGSNWLMLSREHRIRYVKHHFEKREKSGKKTLLGALKSKFQTK